MHNKKKKKIIVLTIIGVIVIALAISISDVISNIENNLSELEATEIHNVDLSAIQDGVYYGRYGEFPVSAEVAVTVESNMIIDIEIIRHENGKGAPAEILTEEVVKEQSLELDAVSGATYSSIVILKAIENALTDK